MLSIERSPAIFMSLMFLDYSNIGNVKIRLLQLVFIFWQELLVVCFQIHLRMMITSSFVAVLVLIIAVHVCAQEVS